MKIGRGLRVGWRSLCLASLVCWAVLASTADPSATGAPSRVRSVGNASDAPALAASLKPVPAAQAPVSAALSAGSQTFVSTYCAACHNERVKSGGLVLSTLDLSNMAADAHTWENVVVKLRAGLMPPSGVRRPERTVIDRFAAEVETQLDRAAATRPNPGRTETLHRLNRAEYQNAIRDLLGLQVDFTELLPPDEISYGFDNIAGVLKLSPLLVERYLAAAHKVSRLALGTPGAPQADIYRVSDQLNQDIRLEGMPVGTRGGTLVEYFAPRDGDYLIKTRLGRGVDYDIPFFLGDQHLEVSIDGRPVKVFTLPATPGVHLNAERQVEQGRDASQIGSDDDNEARRNRTVPRDVDANWVVTVPLEAGFHEIRATFLMKTGAMTEGVRRPFLKPYLGTGGQDQRETREGASLREMEIMGPLNPGDAEKSPTHQRIFTCHPAASADEQACAKKILAPLARRAYRRAVTDDDVNLLLDFYKQGRADGDFHVGIEYAVKRILVSPSFLFRSEVPPATVDASGIYRISDLALASRLSFFIWSSIPDDELLDVALAGRLHEPAVLERQTRRLLADPRSKALTENFAGQWLALRRLREINPTSYMFPDYGPTLADAFKQEAELFFDAILREERPLVDLLTANFTFVNEPLAKHYELPQVKGIKFQRVTLPDDSPRRGLLGKGAILAATALPNRTSPVIRGKWVLQNILGAPPPEPPPNVPNLQENTGRVTNVLTLRQRLEAHRENAVCASCHKLMDPIGFALESFDAVGRYRTYDENFEPIDSSGVYADGSPINGLEGLRNVLVNRKEQFMFNATGKLLTYALGRGTEYYDAPTIRAILRGAAADNYRLSSIILGIVRSAPFQTRRLDS